MGIILIEIGLFCLYFRAQLRNAFAWYYEALILVVGIVVGLIMLFGTQSFLAL